MMELLELLPTMPLSVADKGVTTSSFYLKSLFRWNLGKNMPGLNGAPLCKGFGNEIT